MPRRVVERATVTVGLTQFVVQVPVFAARPNAPFGEEEQGGPAMRQFSRNPVSDKEDAIMLWWVLDSFDGHTQHQIWPLPLAVGQPHLAFLFCVEAQPSPCG